mmetsp:Transcript_10532/g.15423  ORF Transcript_10532/g.15423 Transcript_10532/m.15423 type:complete len:777 (-) Transcript_10532:85-2415(-)|eukprot:CAMPEP_0195512150 /NCGR_PEP_ID=MMETSP0794_2-20130614/4201_1 /TAXON_ID=515487 /ORGANISM="Stephanopyxis turris, Strain CCMP 815" /LENGTH=776 /DNA_ID=CAMNT_0040639873 /DNA_START=156 /DNA_END=2486 /DNA_ORIENTATION=+
MNFSSASCYYHGSKNATKAILRRNYYSTISRYNFFDNEKLTTTSTKTIPLLSRGRYNATTTPPCSSFSTLPSSQDGGLKEQLSLRELGIVDDDHHLNFTTLHELQRNACIAYAPNNLFGSYSPTTRKYEWMTYADFARQVQSITHVLQHQFNMSNKSNSKLGIISNNRWEWAAASTAAYSLNIPVVPLYEQQHSKDWVYILNDAGVDGLMVSTMDVYDKVVGGEVMNNISILKGTGNVLCFDAVVEDEEGELVECSLQRAMQISNNELQVNKNDGIMTSEAQHAPTPSDLANLIYTSGTTGTPKGVELSHSNQVSNIQSVAKLYGSHIDSTYRSLSFLPWAHSYGQTCELFCGMAFGVGMGINTRGVNHLLEDLELVKPEMLFSVPTLYKKIYDGVNNVMESQDGGIAGKLMKRALDLSREKRLDDGSTFGWKQQMQHTILDKLILSKIRSKFGGRLQHGFVAGAACPPAILNFMDDIGIPIYEGYGLTETSPIITLNEPSGRMVGSVGKPLDNINVVVVNPENGNVLEDGEEGEVCVYGPNVMRGYWGREEDTNKVMSLAPDGVSKMFHTGDLGMLTPGDNFLTITGRIKEQYKLENGKYICPTPIEEAIGLSRFINQVVVCGANRPYNVAVLVVNWDAIFEEMGLDGQTEEDLVNDEKVRRLLQSEVDLYCQSARLKKFEIPLDWTIVAPFTLGNDMLTPKLSIRRHVVVKAYKDVILAMYGNNADGWKKKGKGVAICNNDSECVVVDTPSRKKKNSGDNVADDGVSDNVVKSA